MTEGSFPRRAAEVCHAIADGADAMPDAIALMARTVGSDFASFSSLSITTPTESFVIEHGRAPLSLDEKTEWERLLPSHPYARHVATAPDPAPRLTDVVDLRRFAETEVYQVCLEPTGARYQAALRLSRSPESFSLMSLWRSDRDFTDDELRPGLLFAEALRTAWRMRSLLDALSRDGRVDASPELVLTSRQSEVVALVARGLTNQQIATRLGISPRTVRKHVEDLFARTSARSRTELAVLWTSTAARRGISGGSPDAVSPPES